MKLLPLWVVDIVTVMNSEVEKTPTAQVKNIIRRGEGINDKKPEVGLFAEDIEITNVAELLIRSAVLIFTRPLFLAS